MKLTIMSEPTTNTVNARPRYDSFEISEAEATTLIENDYQRRCVALDSSGLVQRRAAQDILVEEFSKPEYANWRGYHRQDRPRGVKFSSYEVWNAHGDQFVGAAASAEEEFEARANALALQEVGRIIAELVEILPETQRAVFTAVHVEGRRPVDIAHERGVSKAAITKSLTKAVARLRTWLESAGVTSPEVSSLLRSDMTPEAQG